MTDERRRVYKIAGRRSKNRLGWEWPPVLVEAIGRDTIDSPYFIIGKDENSEQYAIISKPQAQRLLRILSRAIASTDEPARKAKR